MPPLAGDWLEALGGEFNKPYYRDLFQKVDHEYKTQTVYPPANDVFNAFHLTSLKDVKVVIIGQDPYHEPGQAHGLSFSVKPGIKIPPSLRNIYQELQSDLGCKIPNNGYLEKWAKQGVLMLNNVLTVRAGLAGSHHGFGWEKFTDAVVETLSKEDRPMVFLLWGSPAQKKGAVVEGGKHLVLKSPHPSPLSAHRGFFGCKHFSQCNAYLEANGLTPIDWQIEDI